MWEWCCHITASLYVYFVDMCHPYTVHPDFYTNFYYTCANLHCDKLCLINTVILCEVHHRVKLNLIRGSHHYHTNLQCDKLCLIDTVILCEVHHRVKLNLIRGSHHYHTNLQCDKLCLIDTVILCDEVPLHRL